MNTKENILTFTAPLTRTTNSIGVNLNSYVPFTALSASNYIPLTALSASNYVPFTALSASNYVPFTALSASNYATVTNMNTKENILTFTAPLTRTTNSIGVNLNSYVPFTALSASNYLSTTTASTTYATITNMNNLVPSTAVNLTNGDKTINGILTVTNNILMNTDKYLYLNNGTNTNRIYSSGGSLSIDYGTRLTFTSTDVGPLNTYITNGNYNGYGFNNLSDKRIKYDINNFNDSNLMENFLNLKPKTFKYMSKNNTNTSINHLGFIAQEVEQLFPSAITYGKDFIPNIYQNIECKNNKLIFNKEFDISFLNIDDILSIENKNVKIINIENNVITINENFDKSYVFIYGSQIQDFRYVDKMNLFTMNILATQELYKIIQKQQEQINLILSKL
jgi:hypothetical protein